MPSPVFSNYYVANDLSGIGQQMQQNRDLQAKTQIAQSEQQRLAYAALMQHLAQQQQQAQQDRQFQQELALRQSGQTQENAYREALLGMRGSEASNENAYRYAALENALKQVELQAKLQDPRVAAALATQKGLTDRDTQVSLENWEAETAAARAKAAEYNARAKEIEDEASSFEKEKASEWFTTAGGAKTAAEQRRREKYTELMNLINADKRPGLISPDATGRRFEPVLRPRPYTGATQPYNPLTDVGPRGQSPVGGVSLQSPVNPVAQPPSGPSRDVPIQVITSDGRTWNALSSQWNVIKQRDPGARLVGSAAPVNTPSAPSRRNAFLQYLQQNQPQQPQPNSFYEALNAPGNASILY